MKRVTRKIVNSSVLPALLLAGFSSNISAAGFAVAEQGVKGLGSAFSGGAASADDASTVWFNPAGMTQFSGTHVSNAFHGIIPNAKFKNEGSTTGAAFGAAPLSGREFDGGKKALVPNLYVTHSINDRWSVGLGINAPFGLVTDHDSDWVGRYHAMRSDVKTININPSIAFKVNDKFSVGFGISAQYVDVQLTSAIDMGATCLSLASIGAVTGAQCAGLGLTTPGTIATDSYTKLEGDDWSYGFNVGFMFEPQEGTRFGLSYRSRIDQDVEGKAEFSHPFAGSAGLAGALSAGGLPLLSNQDIKASIDLPESISFSGYHEINSKWSVQGDLTWTKWERFKELRIEFDSRPDAVTPEGWENSHRYALGTTFKMNNKLTLRGGVAYEETPIPSKELRTPRIPDADRIWVAIGGSYAISDSMSVDVGYTHLFIDDPEIDYRTGDHAATGAESVLIGKYDADVDILSIQLNMEF